VTPTVDTTLLSWEFCSSLESDVEPTLLEPVALVAADEYVKVQSTAAPTLKGSGGNSASLPSVHARSIGLFISLVVVHFIC
jgi:hypothetical protein